MNRRQLGYGMTAALALVLWIVPSQGTRGQGTLGDRFGHPDQALLSASTDPEASRHAEQARAALARADAVVAAAVTGL